MSEKVMVPQSWKTNGWFGAMGEGMRKLDDIQWLTVYDWSCLAQCVRIRTGCSATMLSSCIQPAAFCKIYYWCHTLYGVRQTAWHHGHKLAGIVYEAIGESESVESGAERQRKFKRASVYWCTSLSSQQEFFPCFVTAHLPICKRLQREVESPPDVISSTFTYNHIEKNMVSHMMGFNMYSI